MLHELMTYSKKPLVGIIMGSSSDSKVMHSAAVILDEFGVKHEDQIVSAHRTPTRLSDYAKHTEREGFKVIIAGAGGSAHLPGMIASHTIIPVIGVPIMVYNDKGQSDRFKFSAFGGLDSLLSISEMPTGSPVVTVGVNKAANAGLYAVKILANEFSDLQKKLKKYREGQHKSILRESEEMKRLGLTRFTSKKFKR
jgi:5-(carboxyamino)imidazole ribonucleotide mutase